MDKIKELKKIFTLSKNKMEARIFVLCQYSIRNLTVLFIGILVSEQLISAGIEFIVWGEMFPHIIDGIFYFFISWAYLGYSYKLGDFLLDLTLKKGSIVVDDISV